MFEPISRVFGPAMKHIIPLIRQPQIEISIKSYDPGTDYCLLSIGEEPHFSDWFITFDTLEQILREAKKLKQKFGSKKK